MAEIGPENSDQLKNPAGSRPTSVAKEDPRSRLKSVKERENEERQKKLDELKAQAQAAQRFKEQKETERRRRLEELRLREDSRRQQAGERRKQLDDAERDRLEAILRRNQEREARIEAKRRSERHSMVFAFGSSTPRMLQPADSAGSFFGHRRATSTQNIVTAAAAPAAPLTRRQSERELDGGSKKRATSAGGLERSVEASQTAAGCASGYVGRRRTDLMPTIPSRESATPRKSFARSPAPSRPSSSLSQQSTSSIASSVTMRTRPVAAPRRPRPASIAVTGISTNGSPDARKGGDKPPLPKARKAGLVRSTEKLKKKPAASPTDGSPRPHPVGAPETKKKPVEKPTVAEEEAGAGKTEPKEEKEEVVIVTTTETAQITEQLVDLSLTDKSTIKVEQTEEPPPEQPLIPDLVREVEEPPKPEPIEEELTEPIPIEEKLPEPTPVKEKLPEPIPIKEKLPEPIPIKEKLPEPIPVKEKLPEPTPIKEKLTEPTPIKEKLPEPTLIKENPTQPTEDKPESENLEAADASEMTASMIKVRITTEEEAKAALAERRRLAREEAERQAELERRRREEEERAERERQQREEEQQRELIERLRAEERQRLDEAIRETQRRAEEDAQRREEENRIKLLKEESERRAREEADRQKAELQERLKNEEKEREARRKRVEAIMLRTRGKNNSLPQQQTEEKNEENKSEKLNGSKVDTPENGHKNGKDIEAVDNIIPVEALKNANNVDNLSTDDTLNSNKAWQHNTQTDLLM